MRELNGTTTYSPSDLIPFMESAYASWMDRFYLESPDAAQPAQDTPEDRILQAKGAEHERAFLGELTSAGRDVQRLAGVVVGEPATQGILATTSYFSRSARRFLDGEQVRWSLQGRDFWGIVDWLAEYERIRAREIHTVTLGV